MVEEKSREFIAYEIHQSVDMPLVPAPISRPWMDETPQRFAYRCLPLTIANQAGWIISNPSSFCARWNGGLERKDTVLVFDQTPPDGRISSLFGSGTITFNMPYLFRTPKDVNLWVKGPTNWPKHGACPLEGIVETDWTCATFTMNWKLTKPDEMVRFERGEPICMIVPIPRYLLSELHPKKLPLADSSKEHDGFYRWSHDRDEFHRKIETGDRETIKQGWQRDYFQGRDPGTEAYPEHQTKLKVCPFENEQAEKT